MSQPRKVPVIGLVGGVGSGKSALADWLARKRHVIVIDGDKAGHQVLKEASVREQIRRRFGEGVFDGQGAVDRSALGRQIFGDSEEYRQARADLEAIVHPRIREILLEWIEAAKSSPQVEAILLDAAVLLEAGWRSVCDAVVFVEVPFRQRLQRVVASRGWDEDDLARREASQWPVETKCQAADYCLDNSHTVEEAGGRLETIVAEIQEQFSVDD